MTIFFKNKKVLTLLLLVKCSFFSLLKKSCDHVFLVLSSLQLLIFFPSFLFTMGDLFFVLPEKFSLRNALKCNLFGMEKNITTTTEIIIVDGLLCVYNWCSSMDFLPNGHRALITVISLMQNGIAENREKQHNCKKTTGKKKRVWIGKKSRPFLSSGCNSHAQIAQWKRLLCWRFLQPALVSWALYIPPSSRRGRLVSLCQSFNLNLILRSHWFPRRRYCY